MILKIDFGVMARPLEKQLARIGLKADNDDVLADRQREADMLALLSIGGFLTDAEVDRGRRRLMKRIAKDVRPR